MSISFEVRIKAGIKHDEAAQVYVTYAPALKIYSQGETIIQAKTALEDAIQSFLIVSHKNGVMEKCLKAVGFSNNSQEYIKINEEAILEQNHFDDIYDISNSLSLACV